jgi:hypothetical protein
MSYTYLQEQGEESSAESFADIPLYVLSRLNLTAEKSCCNASETVSCHNSQSGTMLPHSTENPGEEKLTSCAGDSHAKILALQEGVEDLMENEVVFGKKCHVSLAKLDRFTRSWKTHQLSLHGGWDEFSGTWPRWGMMRDGECFLLGSLGPIILESDCGSLLPTIGKNEFRGTSKNRFYGSAEFRGAKMGEGVRTSRNDPTYLSPSFSEEQMMWPITWTELAPLETDKFQSWLRQHSEF